MNRCLLECNILYYSNERLRYNFEDLELSVHPNWKAYRSLSNDQYDSYKRQFLNLYAHCYKVDRATAETKLFLDYNNETHLHIALNMCRQPHEPTTWPVQNSNTRDLTL